MTYYGELDMKKVLVTGGYGFLGRCVAAYFKAKGFYVSAIGHGHWGVERMEDYGIDQWITADVTLENLIKFDHDFFCIIHCAGGSSVGNSVVSPMAEFEKTVNSAINVLEYMRMYQPTAKLVIPSSAAVYGEKQDEPIKESASLVPVSPYGFYKKITEELCESYAKTFGLNVSVIRFFSIYGAGLKKQLLWDACMKLTGDTKQVTFFGTGRETRDWLHVEDAVGLMYFLTSNIEGYMVVNGGSGMRETVYSILLQIHETLRSRVDVVMDGSQKEGDPKHYWADIEKMQSLGWQPRKSIQQGLEEYVAWFQNQVHNRNES